MNDLRTQKAYDRKVLGAMVSIYCKARHKSGSLCDDCSALLDYAVQRVERCPLQGDKISCRRCKIHCYAPLEQQKIARIMRFSGARMLFKHPLMAVRHLLRENPRLNRSVKFALQFVLILVFLALGEGVSRLIDGILPGSVIGMIFLFLALAFGLVKEGFVETAAKWLLKYMVLFFLPAAVGLMASWEIIGDNLFAIVLSVVVSIVLVIGVVGLLQQKLGKKW